MSTTKTTFTLIGRPTLTFRVMRRTMHRGIDCVIGLSLDGKFKTFARVADVIFA